MEQEKQEPHMAMWGIKNCKLRRAGKHVVEQALGSLSRSLVEVLQDDEQREAQLPVGLLCGRCSRGRDAIRHAHATTTREWRDYDHAAGPCCAWRRSSANGTASSPCPANYALPLWPSTSRSCHDLRSSSHALSVWPTPTPAPGDTVRHLRPRTPPRSAPAAADEEETTLPAAKRLPRRSDRDAAADGFGESERDRGVRGKPAPALRAQQHLRRLIHRMVMIQHLCALQV